MALAVAAACLAPACGASPDERPLDSPRAEEGFVAADGARLFYRAIGQGDPIVVVHGGPGMEHTYLLPGMEGLAADYRLIFYDQRALGRSTGVVDSASISFDGYLEDLERLREALALPTMHLLGHSWGGLLATAYALRYPDRLRSLILVSPVEPGQRYRSETLANQQARRSPADAAALDSLLGSPEVADRDREALNRVFRIALRSTFADPARAAALRVDFSERTARNGSQVAILVMGPLGDFDLWDELGALSLPVLVAHGDGDPIPVAMARELAEQIPAAQFVLLEGAGHFPFVERPEALFEAIDGFLQDLSPADGIP